MSWTPPSLTTLARSWSAPRPDALIYPVGFVDQMQALPDDDPIDTFDALRWFTGEGRGPGFDGPSWELCERRAAAPKKTWSMDAEGGFL